MIINRCISYWTNWYYCRINAIDKKVLGFFHPYCDNGGGGGITITLLLLLLLLSLSLSLLIERVLWIIIEALLSDINIREQIKIVIYNGHTDTNANDVLLKVKKQFKIDLSSYSDSIILINIRTRFLLEPRWYPIATMICQCLASLIVGNCHYFHHYLCYYYYYYYYYL